MSHDTVDVHVVFAQVNGIVYTSEHSYDLYYCYGIAADW